MTDYMNKLTLRHLGELRTIEDRYLSERLPEDCTIVQYLEEIGLFRSPSAPAEKPASFETPLDREIYEDGERRYKVLTRVRKDLGL